MRYEAKFLSIALVTVQNFNEITRKKGHKKVIDKFLNRFLGGINIHITLKLSGGWFRNLLNALMGFGRKFLEPQTKLYFCAFLERSISFFTSILRIRLNRCVSMVR